ncbi:prepilin peptidase [Amycolatopsis sp. NPDC051903]|uniref:prepilin peptidase n=1 Tax=Amycolatopsis sp. NPDC051903 TaxID=3363936 RepID=UPI00378E1DB1
MSWGMVVAGVVVVPLLVWSVKRAGAPVPPVAAVALVAGALGVVAWRSGADAWARWWWPVPWLLTVVGVPLSLADLKHRRLPDALTLPAYPAMAVALGLAAATGGGPALLVDAVAGTLVFGGAHLAVHRALPGRMGAGDVKLAGVLGAVLGALGWVSMVFAAIAAAVVSAVLAVRMEIVARARWPDGGGAIGPDGSLSGPGSAGFSPSRGAMGPGSGSSVLGSAGFAPRSGASGKPFSPSRGAMGPGSGSSVLGSAGFAPRSGASGSAGFSLSRGAMGPGSGSSVLGSAGFTPHSGASGRPFSPGSAGFASGGDAIPAALGAGGRARAQGGGNGAAGSPRRALRCGVPHGPALVLAAWTCAVFPGVGSGVVPS